MFTFLPPQLLPDVSQGLRPMFLHDASCWNKWYHPVFIAASCFLQYLLFPAFCIFYQYGLHCCLYCLLAFITFDRLPVHQNVDFLKFSPNFTWPKSWHVCSGIGHRLPIIDSFPSLLGALHIGPIPWLVALLLAGRRTSQFVFVSSLHLLKHPKIQRFRGSLSQRSDIKDLAWVDLAVLAFLACQEGK